MIWAMMANETSAFHLVTQLIWLQYLMKIVINLPFRTKKID